MVRRFRRVALEERDGPAVGEELELQDVRVGAFDALPVADERCDGVDAGDCFEDDPCLEPVVLEGPRAAEGKSNSTKVINTLETHNRFERCPNGPQNGRGDRRGRAARRGGCAGGAGARAGCPGAAVGRRRRPGSCNRCQSSHAGRARTRPHRDAAFRGATRPGAARPARCLVGASIAADQGTLAPLARLTF